MMKDGKEPAMPGGGRRPACKLRDGGLRGYPDGKEAPTGRKEAAEP